MKNFKYCLIMAISITALTVLGIVSIEQGHIVLATPNSTSAPTLNQDATTPVDNKATNTNNTSLTNTSNQQLLDFTSSVPLKNATIHSKNILISKANVRETDGYFSSKSIAGTIVNNSPDTVDGVKVYAAIFDKSNDLMDIVSGSVDYTSLKPNEDTPFKIELYSTNDKPLDHFMLFAAGNLVTK